MKATLRLQTGDELVIFTKRKVELKMKRLDAETVRVSA